MMKAVVFGGAINCAAKNKDSGVREKNFSLI